ncbi:MAG: hypothetical protein G01um10148_154 [Parcubacteria group bacterium Gr01-1014_8]|nr:MAG: hypothetical protein G01um10148_154 [Parcubacteria group bacterium Gr01-1014_8]
MALLNCIVCDKEFKRKPFLIRRSGGKYCSNTCHYSDARTGKKISCSTCGKEVYRTPRRLKLSKSKTYFCNKSCQTLWRNQYFVGRRHKNWIHGRAAYRTVLARIGREKICESCKTKDTRVLAIHHIDRVRTNIDPSNLVWLCHNCHFLLHHYDVGRERGLLRSHS